jgi:hypothetical protein
MKVTLLLLLALGVPLGVFAQSPATPAGATAQPPPATEPRATTPPPSAAMATSAASPAPPEPSKVVVPAETAIPLMLENSVNTRTAYVGQAIYCATIFPITVGNHIVIPRGSSIKGAVTQVVRPGRVKGRAQLGLRFDELILPNGITVPLRATLSGFGATGKEDFNKKESKVQGASTKGKDAEKIARTTLPGAEIGTIVGASKGSVGKGLGIGSAAGAAGGLIWVLANRGEDLVLPHGTSLELQLSAPLTFNRNDVERPTRYDQGPALPRREYGPGA